MTQHNGGVGICDAGEEPTEPARMQVMPFWQGAGEYEACTAVVLECVFARLPARELWRCGGVCRAWRRAAGDSCLWRHLLLPTATPHTLRALEAAQSAEERKGDAWSWRKEYALETARWERCGRLQARGASSVPLLCAALHDNDRYLALVDEDAHVTIWEHIRSKVDTSIESEWTVRWNGVVSPEWRGVALAQWAPRSTRLLLAGRLTLVDRYEMIVVHFDEEWCSRIVCRSASGPGGAGCWVDDDTFLSLRLRLLAPGRGCTTLWLNAATQEIYSEYAGVTTPLLRIYNEAAAHISHILVAEVPSEEITYLETETNDRSDQASSEPRAPYYAALRPRKFTEGKNKQRILIGAGGVAGSARGKAQALLMWPLPSLEMPVLWVGDHLAQRVQQHRNRARAPEPAPDGEPDEDAVRALCSPPAATRCLRAQIFGLVLHPRGGCVWATTEAGVWCVSLPALRPLLWLPRAATAPNVAELPAHYLLPCVDDDYFVTPAGFGSGRVGLWAVRSGRRAARLQHDAPALAVFLLKRARSAPGSRRLLVLATDALHVWRSLVD
ncbi:uncharacterized protein LOC124531406 isoform X1 [Vanessa cardui]|uniref:uncharacterized protein LOC124531406 isoform X1 n=1 Tax=Vanessa cardui TaxID=171605 RepID=UPI001F12EC17|nr:uncharacterized protein LOC124531406 isoform X1 [Vanessa cardui]